MSIALIIVIILFIILLFSNGESRNSNTDIQSYDYNNKGYFKR